VPLGTVDEGEPSSLHFGVRWGYVKPRGTRSEDSFVDAHRSTATLNDCSAITVDKIAEKEPVTGAFRRSIPHLHG
jgi:hypothetical protein